MNPVSICVDLLKRVVIKTERARLSASPPWAGYLFREVQRRATAQTVDFIYEQMPKAMFFADHFELLRFSLKACPDGIVAEFGVDAGASINFISKNIEREVHGFDSFEGLPEEWVGYTDFSHRFQRRGKIPRVHRNVKLHVGWFDDTLPKFLEKHPGNFAFIHVDCDLYSSTQAILSHCACRIKPGTVIVFDEFFNYPNWQQHEYRAFTEYVQAAEVHWEYLGYSGNQVSIRITATNERTGKEPGLTKVTGN